MITPPVMIARPETGSVRSLRRVLATRLRTPTDDLLGSGPTENAKGFLQAIVKRVVVERRPQHLDRIADPLLPQDLLLVHRLVTISSTTRR
jgi:hypothetical protein